ncbi:MAG TPA: PKD domain-containing protein, partial [Anaerolineae bacterium]
MNNLSNRSSKNRVFAAVSVAASAALVISIAVPVGLRFGQEALLRAPVVNPAPLVEAHVAPLTPLRAAAAVSDGLTWLSSQQSEGGAWTNSGGGLAIRDTSAAVNAYSALGANLPARSLGAAWLAGANASATDLLARSVTALGSSNNDPQRLSALAARQLADGSWGFDANAVQGNPFDTSLALLALAGQPSMSSTQVLRGLTYLLGQQNAGGWALTPGQPSVQATATALLALAAYQSTYNLQTAVINATAWLQNRQQGNGAYGDTTGSVEETALAHLALWNAGAPNPTALANARAYLASLQSSDGSWSQQVYATALAIQALSQPAATTVTGLVIDNASNQPISGAQVVANTGANTVTGADGRFTFTGIAPGLRSFTVNATGYTSVSFNETLNPGANDLGQIALGGSPPVPSFTYTPTALANTQVVTFTSTSQAFSNSSITEYSWSAGNGAFATNATPNASFVTSFADPGAYAVTLKVRDNYNRTAQVTQWVTVTALPPVVTLGIPGSISTTVGTPVVLMGTVTDPSPAAQSTLQTGWSLGVYGLLYPGTVVTYTYPSVGTYTATLLAADMYGGFASAPVAVTIVPSGSITSTTPITSLVPVTASVSFAVATNGLTCPALPQHVGDVCQYDPSGSFALDGSSFTQATWSWGDGTPNTLQAALMTTTHQYANTGSYPVVLQAQTSTGLSGIFTQTVLVNGLAPTLTTELSRTVVASTPTIIAVVAYGHSPADTAGMTFYFDFGDGTSSGADFAMGSGNIKTANTHHTWVQTGNYNVNITVTDPHGGSATAHAVYQVVPAGAPQFVGPVIGGPSPVPATVGVVFTYPLMVSNPLSRPLTYVLSIKPQGMTIDHNGVIAWTPVISQMGTAQVYALVLDNQGNGSSFTFSILVSAPPIVPPGPGVTVTLRPDLTPLMLDATQVTFDPTTFAVSGRVTATVKNIGLASVTVPFTVTVFDDVDGNKNWTPGVDTPLGSALVTAPLPVNGSANVSIDLGGYAQLKGSILYVVADSSVAVDEGPGGRANNVLASGYALRYVPPAGLFAPRLKWSFNGQHPQTGAAAAYVNNIAAVAPFIDTNGDGKIDRNDVPAVVFEMSEYLASTGPRRDVLYALRGDTGAEICHVVFPDNEFGEGINHVAVGDIDGDGRPDIVILSSNNVLRAFNNDCSLKWTGQTPVGTVFSGYAGAPTLADLDGDGRSEIIYSNVVWNSDGSVRWVGSVASSASHYCCFDTVTDLDGDGKPEIIVNGNVAYHADGTIYWDHSVDWVPGYVAAVNVPGDAFPEIVTVANDWDGVRLLNHD